MRSADLIASFEIGTAMTTSLLNSTGDQNSFKLMIGGGLNARQNNRNGVLVLSPFLFLRAARASLDVRHLNVVDVSS